jgi:hypothetical protein
MDIHTNTGYLKITTDAIRLSKPIAFGDAPLKPLIPPWHSRVKAGLACLWFAILHKSHYFVDNHEPPFTVNPYGH